MKPTFLFIALCLLSTTAIAAPATSHKSPNLESVPAATQQSPEDESLELTIDVQSMLLGAAVGGLATGAVAAASAGIALFTFSTVAGGVSLDHLAGTAIFSSVVGALAGISFAAPGALVGGIVGSGVFEE